MSGYVFPPENRDHVRETHGAIAEAMIARDAATAERLMHDHMAKLAAFFEARYPGLMSEARPLGVTPAPPGQRSVA